MKKQIFIKPGDKFNRLTAIEFSHIGKHNRRHFKFKCDCGNYTTISAEAVTSGNTKSCGCLSMEVKKSKLLPNNLGVIRQIILGYKRHAKGRRFNWELSEPEVISIINKPCYYCGIEPSNIKITKNCKQGFKYSGIDRVNSNFGYFIGNCVPCCNQCNQAKMAMKSDDFMSWVKRVYEYNYE